MKMILFGFLLGIAAIADAGQHECAEEPQGTDTPLLKRCAELADQPTFAFPISRKLGIPVSYTFEPSKRAEDRLFCCGFMIAETP